MLNKRLQIALEFMIIFAFVLVVFLFLFALVASQRAQTSSSQIYSQEQLIAQSVAAQIDAALRAGNGYTARVPITGAIGTLPYQLLVTKSGGVIVNATAGNQALQAFAFSTARNVLSKSSYLQANTFYYNLPIANGTLVIQNSFGTICIDYACPNTSAQAANVSLSSQVVHAAAISGLNPAIVGPQMTINLNTNSYSMCAWADVPAYQSNAYGDVLVAVSYAGTGLVTVPSASSIGIKGFVGGIANNYGSTTYGVWHLYCVVYQGGGSSSRTLYIDGSSVGTDTSSTASSFTGNLIIGNDGYTCCGLTTNPPDYESNVQIYNISLSASQVKSLYQEGIAGAPIAPAKVMGWWPLNGNANDYSGNGNNGAIAGPILFPTVAELFAKVINQAGGAASNVLVGFTTTLGVFNGNQMPANQVYTNYTNANGIAIAFLNQQGNNGQALVKATAYNGNTSLAGNLVGWWPLNLGQGNTTYDISGNGNSGSMKGYAGWSSPNYVANFDGATSAINVGSNSMLSPSSFTIAGWVDLNTNSPWMMIDRGAAGSAGTYYIYGDHVSTGAGNGPDCTIYGPTGIRYDTFFGSLALNTWYFLACSFNSATGTVQTYVNGVLVSSTGSAALGTSTSSVLIGNYTNHNYYTNGQMANIQFYNTALSPTQVLQLYQQGIAAPPITSGSVVGWWPLNGNANDYSGNGFNGTIYGNLNFIPSPASPGNNATSVLAASFNGVSSYITHTPNNALNPSTLTVSAWVRTTQVAYQTVVGDFPYCTSGAQGNGWRLNLRNNGNIWFSIGYWGADNGDSIWTGTYSTNTLYHLVGVLNKTKTSLYVNGVPVASGVTSASLNTINPVTIGASVGCNGGLGEPLSGNVTDVQVYNKSLSASQVGTLYQEGAAGAPLAGGGLVAWWPLNGNANDYSGHGNNGTATNVIYAPQSVTRPALPVSFGGTGTNFNGQSSEITTASNVNLPATTPETLVAWIYTASYPGPGTPAATNPSVGSVVLQEGTTNNANTYIINYTGHLGIDVWGCGTARSVGTVPLNAWVQVAYVYNALANSLAYYINGRPSGTVTPCGYHSTNSPLVLGYNNIGSSNNAFAGAMADVQLYNAAFSPSAIYQLYVSQSPPSASASIPLSWLP
jgi:hypothetical protein